MATSPRSSHPPSKQAWRERVRSIEHDVEPTLDLSDPRLGAHVEHVRPGHVIVVFSCKCREELVGVDLLPQSVQMQAVARTLVAA